MSLLPDAFADVLVTTQAALVVAFSNVYGWAHDQAALFVISQPPAALTEGRGICTITLLSLPDDLIDEAEGDFDRVIYAIHSLAVNDPADFRTLRESCGGDELPVIAWAVMFAPSKVASDDGDVEVRLLNAVDVDGRYYQIVHRRGDGTALSAEWSTMATLQQRMEIAFGDGKLPDIAVALSDMIAATSAEPANLAALDQLGAALAAVVATHTGD